MSRLSRRCRALLPALAPIAALFAAVPANAEKTLANSEVCRNAIGAAEREHRLPGGILQAIALAESGRWDRDSRAHFAWPWTVTALGKGRFFPSRAAAIAEVRRLKRAGISNIDVGCMQVNLHYHPDAFGTLETAFDPAANAGYAAALFARLREQTRSITRAVAHYHSTTRRYNLPYKQKVIRLWNDERRRQYAAARARRIAEWQADKARREAAREAARAAAESAKLRSAAAPRILSHHATASAAR